MVRPTIVRQVVKRVSAALRQANLPSVDGQVLESNLLHLNPFFLSLDFSRALRAEDIGVRPIVLRRLAAKLSGLWCMFDALSIDAAHLAGVERDDAVICGRTAFGAVA